MCFYILEFFDKLRLSIVQENSYKKIELVFHHTIFLIL